MLTYFLISPQLGIYLESVLNFQINFYNQGSNIYFTVWYFVSELERMSEKQLKFWSRVLQLKRSNV